MHPDTPVKAKIFQHGGSQAVRLPKEFRFQEAEVFVRRVGDEIVLSSRPKTSMRTLVEALDEFEPGFRIERQQPSEAELRPSLAPKRAY